MTNFIHAAPPPPISECLASTIFDTGATLQWRNPLQCGGRNDCYYQIKINDGPSVQYIPSTFPDFSTYTVDNLQPDTTYSITISIHNGVSDQDAENAKLRECSIVVKTIRGSKLSVYYDSPFCNTYTQSERILCVQLYSKCLWDS